MLHLRDLLLGLAFFFSLSSLVSFGRVIVRFGGLKVLGWGS